MNGPPDHDETAAESSGTGTPADGGGFDPARIAAAAAGCRLVSRLTTGRFGASAYLPGRRVPGVEVSGRTVRVHVVGRYGHPVTDIGSEVREAVAAAAPGAVVDVVVEDLDTGDLP
ncbi:MULTISPECIES: hypothetical protein [unclassified Streptomyces]|uniref:hypothetical protein n=1 Tax=unclassified Streptomyces TaxID=2593676 RepID=UPI000D1A9B2D|nr:MULTISPECIES: hypothetical protein [unclassified Streptomyces]